MSVTIFIAGALVTLVVAFALAIVIWGAIMDGRGLVREESEGAVPDRSPSGVTEMRAEAPHSGPIPDRAHAGLDQMDAQRLSVRYPG
jgi:hypothetical protein